MGPPEKLRLISKALALSVFLELTFSGFNHASKNVDWPCGLCPGSYASFLWPRLGNLPTKLLLDAHGTPNGMGSLGIFFFLFLLTAALGSKSDSGRPLWTQEPRRSRVGAFIGGALGQLLLLYIPAVGASGDAPADGAPDFFVVGTAHLGTSEC